MATSSDSLTFGVPATLTFTEQATRCVPPVVLEALRSADLRVNLPSPTTTGSGPSVSTLSDNLIRIDSTGALYAPATQLVELSSQQITIGENIAPGVPTTMNFSAPSVRDLETTIPSLFFDFQPPGAMVRHNAPRINGSNIAVDFYRLDDVTGPPYPIVVITGTGRVAVIPAPSTS